MTSYLVRWNGVPTKWGCVGDETQSVVGRAIGLTPILTFRSEG